MKVLDNLLIALKYSFEQKNILETKAKQLDAALNDYLPLIKLFNAKIICVQAEEGRLILRGKWKLRFKYSTYHDHPHPIFY